MPPGSPAEPVLAAWGITTDGKPAFKGLVEPGLPGPGGANVIEVLPRRLDQAVAGARDLLSGLRLEDQPEGLAGFLDVAGHPVGHHTLRWHGDEIGDEQFPLLGADGDAQ